MPAFETQRMSAISALLHSLKIGGLKDWGPWADAGRCSCDAGAGGRHHSAVVASSGDSWTWGSNLQVST